MRLITLVVSVVAPAMMWAQESKAPTVTLRGNSLKIDGQFVHVQGKMPVKGRIWFYQVEHRNLDLFVYNFWTINAFQDTKEKDFGLYHAQAWTVEILDSKRDPEKEVIFDRLNDFYFWGNLVLSPEAARITMNSIKGLPESSYGPVTLRPLK
ncbi:hypothetical protein [Geothrix sp. 21YS21S-4]|uniref:hypothetical protein n=1 Tax=Geothrix sp. 21YS21S-4 TaxID=3068889 RepID=UPI0027BAF5E3|nr:hypothetical protein [Geothrix sp. 21YS21S-4]